MKVLADAEGGEYFTYCFRTAEARAAYLKGVADGQGYQECVTFQSTFTAAGEENPQDDEAGAIPGYRMFYKCECGSEWQEEGGTLCNDRCPSCGVENEVNDCEDLFNR